MRRTAAALEANGITVLRARNSAEAKRIVLDLIPAGAQVHQGTSHSLDASGITDEIERSARSDLNVDLNANRERGDTRHEL